MTDPRPLTDAETDPRKMGPDALRRWIDARVAEANEYRAARGTSSMSPSEEATLRDRYRYAAAR